MSKQQLLTNTSTYVNIIYSEKQSYKTLVKKGLACPGDLVIVADKDTPYGSLHTHNKTLYFLDADFEDRITDKFDNRYIQPSPSGGIALSGVISADGIATDVISVKNNDGSFDDILNISPEDDHYLVTFAPDVTVDITKLILNGDDASELLSGIYTDINNKLDTDEFTANKDLTDSSITGIKSDIEELRKKLQENFDIDTSTFNWGNLKIEALINDLNKIKSDIMDVSVMANREVLDPSSLDDVKERVTKLETDIAEIDEVIAVALININSRLEKHIADQPDSINQKINEIIPGLKEYTDDQVKIVSDKHISDISALDIRIKGLDASIKNTDSSIMDIRDLYQNVLVDTSTKIADVSTKIDNIDSSIIKLIAKVTALDTSSGNIDQTQLDNAIQTAVNQSKEYTNNTLGGYVLKTEIEPTLDSIQKTLEVLDPSLYVFKSDYIDDTSILVAGMSQLSDRFVCVESENDRILTILYSQIIPRLNNMLPEMQKMLQAFDTSTTSSIGQRLKALEDKTKNLIPE